MSAEPKQTYNAQVVGGVDNSEHEGPHGSTPIFKTPVWVTVVRGFQAFFGFIIIILSGLVIHGLALDASVFALVCGLFTLIIVGYTLLSEKAVGCHKAYNYWAHMSLDLLMAIFWLSSMGANAALRASFTVSVNADCWSDGSAVNSGHCTIYRRDGTLEKRVAVATKTGLACMAATAGLSALVMLLFIASLAYLAHQVRLHLQAKKKASSGDNGQVEMNAQQAQPMLNQQYPPQQAPAHHQQYADQNTAYTSQVYPPQAHEVPASAPYDANSYSYGQQQPQPQQYQQQYPQTTGTPAPEQQYQQYPQTSATPGPEQQQQYQYGYPQQQQQQYPPSYASPTATPAPQQPYHPPQ